MNSVAQSYDKFDSDDDWRPMDYSSDADQPPPDIDQDPPPPDDAHDSTSHSNTQVDVEQMPVIPEPPVVEKKTRGKKAKEVAPEFNYDAPESQTKQSKQDLEIEAALDRFMQTEYNVPGKRKPPASKKAVSSIVKGEKKSKSPSGKEDVEKHQSLLMQIDRYRMSERFKDLIRTSGLRLSGIEDFSIEELEDLLTRIRTVVGNRTSGGGSVLGTGILMATSVVENMPITQKFADIHGMSALLSADPEFADIVEQLSIDYSIMSVLSPEKRLALLMIKTGMKMNSINHVKAVMQNKAAGVSVAPPIVVSAPAIVSAGVSTASVVTVIPPPKAPLQDSMRTY